MPDKESSIPADWFRKADADLQTVEILLAQSGDTEIASTHIQQAIEKYLKGHLLVKGWKLRKTHDLPELLDEAVKYCQELEKFRSLCEETTVFYFEARYPFFKEGPTAKEVKGYLIQAKEMAKVIRENTK
ncbi:MAG: HEPN domain-containing protein [Deltaproteobacteria bacterium]|nr:MAG: HEPN domain-containing protein [Deltaproteobacteria bacterium]